ncbi:LINE-1 retrotransposable element ORF2 protein [Vitis vinifera]|uniref:LINE-1 retrotransposable element ORF2 protein n=1 Tax=Vitis vinifera TaxID=29760 RepID=A0A438K6E3_VITVI|nr:LINE-1 retrotransposable element ORF2 protein [Vitis vinifera]
METIVNYAAEKHLPVIQSLQKSQTQISSSVWKGKSLDWVALPACGASGGIVILWDSIKFKCSEKVLGSFFVTVKLNSDEEGFFWLTSVYGPNKAMWRKDFWMELQDLHGLTFPRWCVGGDFNVIRRIFEKMGDSRLTVNMRCFDEFIRESGLLDPPLRNAAFTWSNMQVDPICKRFENMWLLHPEFKEKFRDWWQECTVEGWEGHKFMRKLKFIKSKLKEWNIVVFGDLRERKNHILTDLGRIDRIEQERNLNLDLVSERTLRRKELEDLLLKEEVQWRQKSRVKWIKEEDCNSKFFHRVATGRRSRKFIKSLISERGKTLNNIEIISEEIVNFFRNLYSKPEGDSWKIEGIDWAPISEESAIWLDRPFSEEEVRMAVFQLNKEKAPGPDGFTIAVYQECWDVIKEDLMRVLSGRLRKVLHETIFGSQGAFVEGRQILDAVLIANEVVDEKRRSGVVFKIDFEKAYDHVDWGFLDHVLQRKGFSQKWRSWMRGCLSSSSFAILVNGNAKGWVKASRGLRQGDPLSPFLFTLVADVLSRLMIRTEETGITESFLVGRDRTRVSLLQFADDTIFFSKASLDLLQNLKIILLVFGQVSGLKINLEKSTISGINTRQEVLSSLALVLECRVSEWPLSYLGLPLGGNPKTIGFWDPVVERISRRLDGWKKAYLSLGGRITLIQSCLSHIPSYFLSLFKIPVSIASKIEKMQRDFLWSGAGEGKKDHLIRWEVVSRPKEMGGLGFGKTSMRNIALLGKWLWRFPRERSGLWHKVIASIYGTHPNGWDANMTVRWSHRCPWKAIAQVFQEFSPFVRLVVGNGERIRFWEDLWWGNQTLCSQFADLYRVISVKNLTVLIVLGNSLPLSWNFNFRRNLTDSEIDLLQKLMSSLNSVLLSPSSSDSRAWSLSSSGSFSVKSFFYALSKVSNP